jgi:hypothetical protein
MTSWPTTTPAVTGRIIVGERASCVMSSTVTLPGNARVMPLRRNEIRQGQKMAKTAAQRQATYRARRPHAGHDGNGERRLSVWIETRACLALARLARRYAVTQQTLIEQLVVAEDERILAGIEPDSPQWRAYFIDTSLRSNDGDQIHEKFPNDNNEGAATTMTT